MQKQAVFSSKKKRIAIGDDILLFGLCGILNTVYNFTIYMSILFLTQRRIEIGSMGEEYQKLSMKLFI